MHPFRFSEIQMFGEYLQEQERAPATVKKYLRHLEQFYLWLPEAKLVDKAMVIAYKEFLSRNHAPGGVNTVLAALNGFFRFRGWQDCTVKPLRIQRQVFSSPETELTREEYIRLVEAARRKKDTRLELLLLLMTSTGMRVSEIQYVTAEAVARKRVPIRLKGKIRIVLLPEELCRRLLNYQNQQNIRTGPIFRTKSGKPVDRRKVWAQMKQLCAAADVPQEKVFPHNLRHLFARTFYGSQKDIVKLADVLGHSSIETTRIYLLSSGQEHRKILEDLQLIC